MSFGFRVYQPTNWDSGEPEGWTVSLPHQCDAWVIAGDEWGGDGLTQDAAITELEKFIAEAQVALAALRRGEEYP